jgi:hypothetical protein
MSVHPALATAALRSEARECCGVSGNKKPTKDPKKPFADHSRSTARAPGRRLTQRADVEAAIAWRLDGIDQSDVDSIARRLRPLANDFTDSQPGVAAVLADLRLPGDRRAPWSLACAILAEAAVLSGDVAGFWQAGVEVLQAYRQSHRGRHDHRRAVPVREDDGLDRLIAKYLRIDPAISSKKLFGDFAAVAGGYHKVLADFDEGKDALACQLDPDDEELTNIGRKEFEQRMQRLAKR